MTTFGRETVFIRLCFVPGIVPGQQLASGRRGDILEGGQRKVEEGTLHRQSFRTVHLKEWKIFGERLILNVS